MGEPDSTAQPDSSRRPTVGLLRDPLVHFAILGGLIFVAAHFLDSDAQNDVEDESRTSITVTAHLRESLAEDRFRRTGERPAGQALTDLVDQHVRDEALYREALRLGLDRGDTIVRRRVVQKMEFLIQSATEVAAPDDAALEGYLEAHREDFTSPARVAFTHIYLSRDSRGQDLAADGEALMRTLAATNEDPDGLRVPEVFLGDPFLLGATFPLTTEGELADRLGVDFAAAVTAAPAREWAGPFESSYGLHAVRVTNRAPAYTANLDGARRELERAWTEEERARLAEEAIVELVASYPREDAP
ncbi:MAG: peptidyl-prolyl cis-trans isomerase [Deltaproteobacteria bacterium]|nr:peptidyl-prolyl cis-trans isomerase [Deltaproteobacteria bacterium]